MRIAVITPYHSETEEQLARCRDSISAQTHPCEHIWVADGATHVFGDHIVLPKAHADYGDTPRLVGTLSAYQQGFDGVCWLDGDNWLEPDHVSRLVDIANKQVVSVVTATRNLMRPDGSLLGVCTESDGKNFCDTNCYLVMRDAIPSLAPFWGFKDRKQSVVGDRVVWSHVLAKYPRRGHCSVPTVNYTTKIANHYLAAGEEPPEGARVILMKSGQAPVSMLYADLTK